MAQYPLLDTPFSPAVLEEILDRLAEIQERMPFLVNLTKAERMTMAKFGPKALAFDEACATRMESQSHLVPRFVDAAAVARCRQLRLQLAEISRRLLTLAEMTDDTRMLAGGQVLSADLAFYQTARQAARLGMDGAESAAAELGRLLPKRRPGEKSRKPRSRAEPPPP